VTTSTGHSKKRLTIVGFLLAIVTISVAFLIHSYSVKTSCEGIFQQTQLNLATSLEVLSVKGSVGFGNDKIQDLSEKAQLVGLNFKACCVAAENGLMPEEKFLECKNTAGAFESQIAQAAQHVRDAREAQSDGKTQDAKRISAEAVKVLLQSDNTVSAMPTNVLGMPGSNSSVAVSEVEKEPNNDLFQSTPIALESTVSGVLDSQKDVDVFQIKNSSDLRDWISVSLKNKSQKMAPQIDVHDGKRRSIVSRYETTRGADLEVRFVAEASEDHYVSVSNWSSGSGPYVLEVKPSKYYDAFEPNDSAATAKLIALNQTIEATILDAKDSDWYRFHGAEVGQRRISLQNIKGKLKPEITVFNADKSEISSRYDTTEGANLSFAVEVPTSEFYVKVSPWSSGWGRYALQVE